MVHYVKTIDELVELIDREFSGVNAFCPICKSSIGTVNIDDVELGLPALKFTQFKFPGVFCTQGHCIISMEQEEKEQDISCQEDDGLYRLHIDDLGIKVFEVMKIIKPYLNIDESIPNSRIYWMLMNNDKSVPIENMCHNDAVELLDKLQKLGARVRLIRQGSL